MQTDSFADFLIPRIITEEMFTLKTIQLREKKIKKKNPYLYRTGEGTRHSKLVQ